MNKQIVIALFLGSSAAYKLNFATGMNGDEDLGQDIIMKGEKFHYAANPARTNSTAAGRYQNVQLEWDNPVQGPAEGVLFPQTGHAEHHTTYFAKKQPDESFVQWDQPVQGPAEGVLFPQTGHAEHHTTYFAKKHPDESFVQWDNPVQGPAEGVLFPQTGHAEHHTTYFAKKSPEEAFVGVNEDGEPEKVEVLDPKIAKTHTTFYDKKNGVWRNQQLSSVDPIGPTNYDPWVYETSRDGMGAQVQHAQQTPANATQAATQIPIGQKGQRKDVYEFLNDNGFNKDTSMLDLEPERVHVLEPIAHQWRANTNLPGPRTTFYDKQNGMWRQEPQL